MFITKLSALLLTLVATITATMAQAELLEAVPNGWRLQDYGSGALGVSLFLTGSPCLQGNLHLPAESQGSKDRLWSMVMAAKIARIPVGIFYHVDSGTCLIDSFYLKETN